MRTRAASWIASLAIALPSAACNRPDAPDTGSLLRSENWRERAFAAQQVEAPVAPEDLALLRDLSTADPDAAVRRAALLAVDRVDPERGFPALIAALEDRSERPDIRSAAAIALGAHSRMRAGEALVDCLDDSHPRVFEACEAALARGHSRRALVERSLESLPALSPVVRERAAARLGLLRAEEASRNLVRVLRDDPVASVRRAAAIALARIGARLEDEAVLAALADGDPSVRAAALGLVRRDQPCCHARADELRFDADARVRGEAAIAAARLAGRRAPIPDFDARVLALDDVLTLDSAGTAVLARRVSFAVDRAVDRVNVFPLPVPHHAHEVRRARMDGEPAAGSLVRTEDGARIARVSGSSGPLAGGTGEVEVAIALEPFLGRTRSGAWRGEVRFGERPVPGTLAFRVPEGARVMPPASRLDPDGTSVWSPAPDVLQLDLPAGSVSPRRSVRVPGAFDRVLAATLLALLAAGAVALGRRAWKRNEDEWILAIAGIAVTVAGLSPYLVEDNLTYLAYARTLALDADAHIADDLLVRNATNAYAHDPRDPYGPTGAGVLWAPVFLPFRGTGAFSLVPLTLVQILSSALVIAAWILAWRMARKRASRFAALAATLAGAFGTNVLLFQIGWTGSSHAPAIFFAACFFHLLDSEPEGVLDWLLCGLAAGLLVQARPQWAPVALFAPVALVARARGRDPVRVLRDLVALGAGALAGFAPQAIAWTVLDGRAVSDVHHVGRGRFGGALTRVVPFLFGGRRHALHDPPFVATGVLATMPLLVPAAAGLGLLFRRERLAPALWGAAVLVQVAIVLSYPVWWGRMTFSTPYLVPLFPIAVVGLAVALDALAAARIPAPALVALVAAGCLPNLRAVVLELAHRASSLPWGREAAIVWEAFRQPDIALRGEVFEKSGSIALPLRMLVDAFASGRVLPAIGVVSLAAAALVVSRRALALPLRRLRPALLTAGLAVVALGSVLFLVKGARTDLELDYQPILRAGAAHEVVPVLHTRASGEMRSLRFQQPRRTETVDLVGFTRGTLDLPDGTEVADLVLRLADGTTSTRTLRLGEEIADVEVTNPSLVVAPAHRPGRDPVQERELRDRAERPWRAQGYRTTVRVPAGVTSLELRQRIPDAEVWITHVLLVGAPPPPGWKATRPARWVP